jgi:hypothetical protein
MVVMDNLSSHKVDGVREQIEALGVKLLYLVRMYGGDLSDLVHNKQHHFFARSSVRPNAESMESWWRRRFNTKLMR